LKDSKSENPVPLTANDVPPLAIIIAVKDKLWHLFCTVLGHRSAVPVRIHQQTCEATMKRLSLLIGVLIAIGCNQSPPGGPGATQKQPVTGMADNTFKLDGPMTETSIKQGETKTVTVSISRGKNFDQDVNMTVTEPAPKGITVTPAGGAIRASEKETTLTIEAAKDAALGHHVIKLEGAPSKGGAKTTLDLKIEVKSAS